MESGLRGLINSAMLDEQRKLAVWAQAPEIPGLDPAEWRHDEHSNLIRFSEYGQLTEYGWEIDHRMPSALGGSDEYANLRPLHWNVNRSQGGTLAALFRRAAK